MSLSSNLPSRLFAALAAHIAAFSLFTLIPSFGQNPASQQVPGAAARLKSEYAEDSRKFYGDSGAVKAPIVASWTGELPFETAGRHPAPKDGIVSDGAALQTLWQNWRLGGRAPTIDFDQYVVLAATGGDSLARFEVLRKLTKTGDLRYRFVPAELVKTGGPAYFVFLVPRENVKLFNGRKIPPAAQNQAQSPGASQTLSPGASQGASQAPRQSRK